MNITSDTLVEFHNIIVKNNHVFPEGISLFFKIGDANIELNVIDGKYHLIIVSGTLQIGHQSYELTENDIIKSITVNQGGGLTITNPFRLSNVNITNYGVLTLARSSSLHLRNALIVNNVGSILNWEHNIVPIMNSGSAILILGLMRSSLTLFRGIYTLPTIEISPISDIIIVGHYNGVDFALTMIQSINETALNRNVRSTIQRGNNMIEYNWVGGDPIQDSHIIDIALSRGYMILGNVRLIIDGVRETIPKDRLIRRIRIMNNVTLHLSPDSYRSSIHISNGDESRLDIGGKIIVEGPQSSIIVDNRLTVDYGGYLDLLDDGSLIFIFGEVHLHGTMDIDNFSQLRNISKENIYIDNEAKFNIQNRNKSDECITSGIPLWFYESYSHVLTIFATKERGIVIDTPEIIKVNGIPLDDAIDNKLIDWNDSFIHIKELDEPLNVNILTRLFRTYSHRNYTKLMSVIKRLRDINLNRITIKSGDDSIAIDLSEINIVDIVQADGSNEIYVETTNDGTLLIQSTLDLDGNTIDPLRATILPIIDNKAIITL